MSLLDDCLTEKDCRSDSLIKIDVSALWPPVVRLLKVLLSCVDGLVLEVLIDSQPPFQVSLLGFFSLSPRFRYGFAPSYQRWAIMQRLFSSAVASCGTPLDLPLERERT